jgi:hypothetical protein
MADLHPLPRQHAEVARITVEGQRVERRVTDVIGILRSAGHSLTDAYLDFKQLEAQTPALANMYDRLLSFGEECAKFEAVRYSQQGPNHGRPQWQVQANLPDIQGEAERTRHLLSGS